MKCLLSLGLWYTSEILNSAEFVSIIMAQLTLPLKSAVDQVEGVVIIEQQWE